MNKDQLYMQRCLEIAQNGLGNTYPNPMVGSVIVHNDKIIGEGFHHKAGEPHAEVNAIHSVVDKELLKESTIYVNLEPCAHFGKTPPCSLLIKEMNIPKVVIGCTDTFSEVSGKGIKILQDAGVDVTVGVLEKESRELNKRFFTFHEKKRPYIILKWAETEDGLIDIDRTEENYGQPTWITNTLAKKLVHKWRRQEQSILVGTNTAIKDNPSLTVREWEGNDPVRILIDRTGRVPNTHHILDNSTKTIVFTGVDKENSENTDYCKISFDKDIVPQINEYLYEQNIQSIIIEGGKEILQLYIYSNYWDEARRFVGDKWFKKGTSAPKIDIAPISQDSIGNSRLFFYRNNDAM
ncbi:bifunctional diaminohydroxyphosphoribosylaminopyrimidine deaminase/5-amino-6-(5-phosphoribosylamino)uracil reductase RibD [Plebeiibacterium sediminum]|uniref:Riboflavin biosynthesis protein RibD n=1 Tax=Plebeiibacterium sediminum TaxID=2992112 RepID=A0AAE3M0Z9_9BACT|nr:bifunctional diaminohydroxyphosphoribosylaminopyrimidine deaminase/5-amino-6-(5-phosphoribosylamino)uracil reductase RibD [Plebeiobacterium sediminum]MCW3784857.1 bifunctional diaminohydroxyphosphoribosylaminopyrimidine deaminase/5-amino-6-(5-phosphoribosylamino)uracil reductase RibD [Plebeiobacterium sediminum]